MKVIVVGLGSMGRRRIRLMKQYDSNIVIRGVDSNETRRKEVSEELNISVFSSIREAVSDGEVECGFVCTSPLSHAGIIRELIGNNIHVFTEINLIDDGYKEFIEQKKAKVFLSSTFLYRRDIRWMIERIHIENKANRRVNYIYHTGQYLPDWHPWENYKSFFVGDRRTNGCREIFAIEFPWIVDCFGQIKSIQATKDKLTDLQIDYPDNYMLMIEHENGNRGILAVDVVARKAIRKIEIYNEYTQIYWNGTPNSLEEYDLESKEINHIETYENIIKDKNYCDNIIENAYMDEIDAFFTFVNGDDSKIQYGFEQDYEVLKWIDKIEEE